MWLSSSYFSYYSFFAVSSSNLLPWKLHACFVDAAGCILWTRRRFLSINLPTTLPTMLDSPLCRSFPQLPTLNICHGFMTLEDAGRCWLSLTAPYWWTKVLKGFELTCVSCVDIGEFSCRSSWKSVTSDVAVVMWTSLRSGLKLFLLEGKLIGVYWLVIPITMLDPNIRANFVQSYEQTMNRPVDLRSLLLMPSPGKDESEQDWQTFGERRRTNKSNSP